MSGKSGKTAKTTRTAKSSKSMGDYSVEDYKEIYDSQESQRKFNKL